MVRRNGMLLCLVGPAGGGKTSLGERLVREEQGRVRLSVSATTRQPRPGEVPGVAYHFISRSEFEGRAQRGEFFETEEVHGNWYGTLRETVESSIRDGVDLVLDIDIKGARRFKEQYPNSAVLCFVVPPTFSILVDRLKKRPGTTLEDLRKRITTAHHEYTTVMALPPGTVDYLLVNDQFDATYERLLALVYTERLRFARMSQPEVAQICSVPMNAEELL